MANTFDRVTLSYTLTLDNLSDMILERLRLDPGDVTHKEINMYEDQGHIEFMAVLKYPRKEPI